MSAYFSGLLLGLVMILPIGVQNLFVLNQGLSQGMPRALVAVVAAAVCDTLLILTGALGASALLAAVPGLRSGLILAGVVFLVVLGVLTLRSRPEPAEAPQLTSVRAVALQAAAVSILNPHAILDTVGVIGGAVAAHAPGDRAPFTAGAATASWLWFFLLGSSAAALGARLTYTARLWIQRVSGAAMLLFALALASELW